MILIIILLVSLTEYFVLLPSSVRSLAWLSIYHSGLAKRLSHYKLWQGPVGIVLLIVPPLFIITLLYYLLDNYHIIAGFLFSLIILFFCIGPDNLFSELKAWLSPTTHADEKTKAIKADLVAKSGVDDPAKNAVYLLRESLLKSNHSLFAVILWFAVLGPFGAVLYRLTAYFAQLLAATKSDIGDSANDLYCLLNFIPVRLLALSFSICGSMLDCYRLWFAEDKLSLYNNDQVIIAAGYGAMQIKPNAKNVKVETGYNLIRHSLVVWLVLIALITLSGMLS